MVDKRRDIYRYVLSDHLCTKVLDRTNWRIKGPHGAAELLGLKPSTLYTKMNKLAIPTSRNKDAIPT